MFETSPLGAHDVVFFLDETGVCKDMMYAEFEAVLDGVVGLDEFANQVAYSVFAVVGPGLQLDAAVFFTLEFDGDGYPPQLWNVPFHGLIQKAAKAAVGPFQTKVVSRSACPIEWHRDSLWDPSQVILDQLLEAVAANRLCLPAEAAQGLATQAPPSFAVQPAATLAPVASTTQPEVQPQQSIDTQTNSSLKALSEELLQMTERANGLAKENGRLLAGIEQEKTKVATLVAKTKEAMKVKYDKKLKTYEQELKHRYTAKVNEIQAKSGATHESLDEKIKIIEEKDQLLEDKKQQLLERNQKIADQEVVIQEQKDSLDATATTIESLEVKIRQLSDELAGFRKERLRLMANGADKFFERLEHSGLNFIAFHPGAGHVSVSVKQVGEYLDNPKQFAADKLNMSLEAYEYWLAHYESPCCQAPIIGGKTCGQKIQRHENPKDFVPGISDRCEKHRTGISAAGRVFSS